MSASGTKQTCRGRLTTSTPEGKTDVPREPSTGFTGRHDPVRAANPGTSVFYPNRGIEPDLLLTPFAAIFPSLPGRKVLGFRH